MTLLLRVFSYVDIVFVVVHFAVIYSGIIFKYRKKARDILLYDINDGNNSNL